MLPMYIQGVSASKASEYIDPKYVLNFEGMTTSAEVSNYLIDILGSKLHVNNVPNCTFTTARNGVGLMYSSCTNTAYDASLTPIFSIGPIPIPKLIYLDAYFGLAGSHREVFHISAVCDSKIYTLLHVIQAHVDGNYSYAGSSGLYVDHAGTKLLNFYTGRGSYTYAGSVNPREFTRCFTNGETECYISITRPNHTYSSGATYPSGNTSTLSIKELKIEW